MYDSITSVSGSITLSLFPYTIPGNDITPVSWMGVMPHSPRLKVPSNLPLSELNCISQSGLCCIFMKALVRSVISKSERCPFENTAFKGNDIEKESSTQSITTPFGRQTDKPKDAVFDQPTGHPGS